MPATEFYLRSYPLPDDVRAHAAAAEDDGWDGLLLTDTQNLSMDVVVVGVGTDEEALDALVRGNVGVSVLPVLRGGRWRSDPNLRLVPLPGRTFIRSVSMVQRKANRQTLLTQTIAEMLRR